MERWQRDNRRDVVFVDMEALVPKDHLLRKIERVMDYDWLYARLSPLYCHGNGRNGTDPVVLVKMVLLQHLFGIASLRETHRRIMDTLSYRAERERLGKKPIEDASDDDDDPEGGATVEKTVSTTDPDSGLQNALDCPKAY